MATQTQDKRKISPAERARLFAQTTRQNFQMLPAITSGPNQTASFTLPKTRLLAKIRVMVEATLNVAHATETSYIPSIFAPFNMLRRLTLDLNNGFSPFLVNGDMLYLYNRTRGDSQVLDNKIDGRGKVVQELVASVAGADNKVRFVADLPVQLNARDPIGLIMLQNEETVVTVTADVGDGKELVTGAGFTTVLSNVKITPMTETFSIPAIKEAFPDISVLKLVHSKNEEVAGGGVKTVRLPVGTTYRKVICYITDENDDGVADDALQGDFEIVFNQADTPYRVNPKILAAINHEQFGYTMPAGVYIFDFSYQGISNFGGARDYIDTERLTEFWLRFQTPTNGKIQVVYETLSQLRQA